MIHQRDRIAIQDLVISAPERGADLPDFVRDDDWHALELRLEAELRRDTEHSDFGLGAELAARMKLIASRLFQRAMPPRLDATLEAFTDLVQRTTEPSEHVNERLMTLAILGTSATVPMTIKRQAKELLLPSGKSHQYRRELVTAAACLRLLGVEIRGMPLDQMREAVANRLGQRLPVRSDPFRDAAVTRRVWLAAKYRVASARDDLPAPMKSELRREALLLLTRLRERHIWPRFALLAAGLNLITAHGIAVGGGLNTTLLPPDQGVAPPLPVRSRYRFD